MRPAILTSYLACAASALAASGFEFMMVPLQIDLGLTVDQMTGLSLIPVAGSLLVVFLIGALVDRIGMRRVITIGATVYALGALLVLAAFAPVMVLTGRALGGVGAITLAVIGVATLNDSARTSAERGRIFGVFAAIVPATIILGSVIAATVTDLASWRVVPVLWLALGAVILLRVRGLDRGSGAHERSRELLTPLLAGVVLAGIGLFFTTRSTNTSIATFAACVSAASLVILVVIMFRVKKATLDLRVLREPGSLLIAVAILLVTSTNFFFFVNLFLQYRYAIPLAGIALMMAIPQLTAVAGGILGGRVSARLGSANSAVIALIGCAVAAVGFLFISPRSPAWLPILVLAVFALPSSASVGPLTQCLLDRAPADGSGSAAAVRSALWSLGGIVGGVVVGTVTYQAFTQSLARALKESGLLPDAASAIAEQVRSGALVSEIAAQLNVTDPRSAAELLVPSAGLNIAQVDALHTLTVIGVAVCVLAALCVLMARRRLASSSIVAPDLAGRR
jgi:DHA2 family methylenomycin A resistance protein-like MFS transporter